MTSSPSTDSAQRQQWLSVLVHAPRAALCALAAQWLAGHRFELLRAPESGLLMLRGRIGGDGDRFNVGEATVSRCVVRLRGPDGCTTVGVGYRLGRDLERVRWIAEFDALLQQRLHQADVLRAVIAPLAAQVAAARAAEAQRVAATRVRFFELQPGVAA